MTKTPEELTEDWKAPCDYGELQRLKAIAEKGDTTSTDIIDCNIRKENMRLQAEINRLREALKEIARNKTTEEQQGNPDYVDEDGDLIGDFEYAYDEFIKIARKALNGESEE